MKGCIIEVFIRDNGISESRYDGSGGGNDEVIVRIVVQEVVVNKLRGGNSWRNSRDSRLLNDDGEVIVGVGIVEVLVRNSCSWMSNRSSDFKVSSNIAKDWIVVEGIVVKVILIRDK